MNTACRLPCLGSMASTVRRDVAPTGTNAAGLFERGLRPRLPVNATGSRSGPTPSVGGAGLLDGDCTHAIVICAACRKLNAMTDRANWFFARKKCRDQLLQHRVFQEFARAARTSWLTWSCRCGSNTPCKVAMGPRRPCSCRHGPACCGAGQVMRTRSVDALSVFASCASCCLCWSCRAAARPKSCNCGKDCRCWGSALPSRVRSPSASP